MKRKTMLVRTRNPLVALAKFRKGGAHGRTEKAMRREVKMDLRERSLVTRHPAFNRLQDEFRNLSAPTTQITNAWRFAEVLTAGKSEQMRVPRQRVRNRNREANR
jgi:hypothetical protein